MTSEVLQSILMFEMLAEPFPLTGQISAPLIVLSLGTSDTLLVFDVILSLLCSISLVFFSAPLSLLFQSFLPLGLADLLNIINFLTRLAL